jgi:hypothetical protein
MQKEYEAELSSFIHSSSNSDEQADNNVKRESILQEYQLILDSILRFARLVETSPTWLEAVRRFEEITTTPTGGSPLVDGKRNFIVLLRAYENYRDNGGYESKVLELVLRQMPKVEKEKFHELEKKPIGTWTQTVKSWGLALLPVAQWGAMVGSLFGLVDPRMSMAINAAQALPAVIQQAMNSNPNSMMM